MLLLRVLLRTSEPNRLPLERKLMITKEQEAAILRLFHAEKWEKTAIATELRIHHSAVTRVLERSGRSKPTSKREFLLQPYVPFIKEMLDRYPKLTASRLHRMVRERGYTGGPDHFRHALQKMRPARKAPEAFLRLKTLPGEEAQMDWGHFGRIRIGQANRQVMAFLMVLSHSRRIFLKFYPGQDMSYFLRGHVQAFRDFGGVPRKILYDNLKSAVLDRSGDAIRFNPDLLALSSHYKFEPRPVAVARGNEKGRVERAVRYVRTAFFEGLSWDSFEDLNRKAAAFCDGVAMERLWASDHGITVREAFDQERPSLMPLPNTPFPAFDRVEVTVGKTQYVRFDRNDYSVPSDCVRKTLTVVATMEIVRVLDGVNLVAQHRRSFDRGLTVEDPKHLAELVQQKRRARKGRGIDRLGQVAPSSAHILRKMAERNQNIGSAVNSLTKLLELHGRELLEYGIREALSREVYHVHGVRHAITKRRAERGQKQTLPIQLPDDPRVRDLIVIPHDLSIYDKEPTYEEAKPKDESAEEALPGTPDIFA